MKRFLLAASVVVLLSACGSSVKLDDVPVEDKAGSSVGTTPANTGATGSDAVPRT